MAHLLRSGAGSWRSFVRLCVLAAAHMRAIRSSDMMAPVSRSKCSRRERGNCMKFRASAVMICAMLLGGSAFPAFAGNVRTDYNHQANFAKYHTYTWGNVKTSDPFYLDRIKAAVDKQLQAKGWQLVTSDASVTNCANDSLHNQKETQTMYEGFGGGWGGGWGWGGWGWGGLGNPGGFGD